MAQEEALPCALQQHPNKKVLKMKSTSHHPFAIASLLVALLTTNAFAQTGPGSAATGGSAGAAGATATTSAGAGVAGAGAAGR